MNPQHPIYIVSKGRWRQRLTGKILEFMGVPYHMVIEQQEYESYAAVMDKSKLLVLDKRYQDDYDTCDDLGDTKSKGPGPARNFAWDHSVDTGHTWHWVMDDNIRCFYRLNRNLQVRCWDGTPFRCMEDFVVRYENVAMAGPCCLNFGHRRRKVQPVVFNTRIYSCNLIRNDIPYRWRARYNEDTDLSLRMLKDGWCTVQFYAFLQNKMGTQSMKGGNTEEFYEKEGTIPKTAMLFRLHPDVTRVVRRWGRCHHYVDYKPFKRNRLVKKPGADFEGVDEYGMVIVRKGGES